MGEQLGHEYRTSVTRSFRGWAEGAEGAEGGGRGGAVIRQADQQPEQGVQSPPMLAETSCEEEARRGRHCTGQHCRCTPKRKTAII